MDSKKRIYLVDEKPTTAAKSAPLLSLREFVMCDDSQPQVQEAPPSPEGSDSEGLEEAMTAMMDEFQLDLCHVTQALLKNSGEVGSTRHFLRTGVRPDGYPIWEHKDDLDLKKNDPKLMKQLIEKYSMRNVAQRALFLAT
ncbi:telomeric repeat-binding factor 2-interacting protein 1 isoform X3 [Pseudophryne corroboree]|uniref:telomeric repeat-binding factor 2-interacting protein 1 isoform X3 n=1 Tax=Pseudophryne corroboree TaxID=495146 RepID=UPI0030814932